MSEHKYRTLRVHFSEKGKIRFVSHRDVARLFERACRQVGLPVAYSEGFSPRPRFSFGLALSVAHESDAEYFDVELTKDPDDMTGLCEALTACLSDGLTVHQVALFERKTISLQQSITSCLWRVEVVGTTLERIKQAAAQVSESSELPVERTRKGKISNVDVRPSVLSLNTLGETDRGVLLETELATQPMSLRPTELINILDSACNTSSSETEPVVLEEGSVCRLHQWITAGETRCEPMRPPDSPAGHEEQVFSHAS